MTSIHAGEQIELLSLIRRRSTRALNVRDQVCNLRLAAIEISSLVNARQECTSPVRRIGDRQPRTHRYEAGQVLVLAAEAIRQPRPVARTRQPFIAGVHQPHALLVIRRVGIHRLDDANSISVLARRLLKDLAAP